MNSTPNRQNKLVILELESSRRLVEPLNMSQNINLINTCTVQIKIVITAFA